MKEPVRIFIADDHKLMLEGLATLIQSIDGFVLAGKVSSGKALIEALQTADPLPHVCVVDIEMPEMDGFETVKAVRQKFQKVKTVVLTMHDESHFVSRMIAAGANGYLLKNVDREVFIDSIYKVLSSETFVTEGINTGRSSRPAEANDLTHREKQILRLIVLGKTNKEIAEELFISDRTADTHRTNIKRKLKISTLAQLIQYAKEHGLSDFWTVGNINTSWLQNDVIP